MRKFIVMVFLLLASPSYALTCGTYQPSCTAYTKGLSYVLQTTPVRFYSPSDSRYFTGFSEAEFNSIGLTDEIEGGVVPDAKATQVLWNAVRDLNSAISQLPNGSRTFNYPSRALNSCFQISATKDADFHYKVDVTTGLSLTAGAQGTVAVTSYTNNSCSTGAQLIADGTSGQSGTLVVGLALNQVMSVSLDGKIPAGKWVRISTANTVGTPTFAIRAAQSEVIEP